MGTASKAAFWHFNPARIQASTEIGNLALSFLCPELYVLITFLLLAAKVCATWTKELIWLKTNSAKKICEILAYVSETLWSWINATAGRRMGSQRMWRLGKYRQDYPFRQQPGRCMCKVDICQCPEHEPFNTEYPIPGMGFHHPLVLQSVNEAVLFPPSIKLENKGKPFKNYAGN